LARHGFFPNRSGNPGTRYDQGNVRTPARGVRTALAAAMGFTAGFRFGNRLRNQRLKAPFYALKSVTKAPNLIDFACWGADS
jgi:hypothetical protein